MTPQIWRNNLNNIFIFVLGDIRVNQNPQLALLQTVLLREHNRIADKLCELNPKWDDEKLFQEARRILIAMHQQITYYEYLPEIIGIIIIFFFNY